MKIISKSLQDQDYNLNFNLFPNYQLHIITIESMIKTNLYKAGQLSKYSLKYLSLGYKSISQISHASISKQRQELIRSHPPLTQYPNLNPITTPHLKNKSRIIKDHQTKLTFLIEEGGFPGCSDVGIGLKVGTQDEDSSNAGSLMYLKNYVHMKPTFEEIIKNYQFLHQTGSSFDFNYDVLNSYVKCSFFQEDFEIMVNLLLDLALRQKNMLEDNFQTNPDMSNMVELVRRTAFGNSGIGMPSTGLGNVLTNDQFVKFQQKINPHSTVISLSNLSQPERYIQIIKNKIKQNYSQFLQRKSVESPTSIYKGGFQKYNSQEEEFFQFAVAFPSVDYRDTRMELYNILRILLGSASSFSSGGPGKGMHSRCTKNLLNKVACVENASFINEHFVGHGIFGLTVGGPHHQSKQVVQCALQEFKRLQFLIPEEELNRAKNILAASVYSNIQRQCDRLEEMTKHLYCYGRVRIDEYEEKIRAVTSEQIKKQMERIFQLKPTFVARGNAESFKSIGNEQTFKRALKI